MITTYLLWYFEVNDENIDDEMMAWLNAAYVASFDIRQFKTALI